MGGASLHREPENGFRRDGRLCSMQIRFLDNRYLFDEFTNHSTWKLQMAVEIMDAADVGQKSAERGGGG